MIMPPLPATGGHGPYQYSCNPLTGVAVSDGGLLEQGVQLQEILIAGRGLQLLGILGGLVELLENRFKCSENLFSCDVWEAEDTHLLQGHVERRFIWEVLLQWNPETNWNDRPNDNDYVWSARTA